MIFILLAFKLSSQCSYSVIATYTPATCPTCCNGAITATLTGFGATCAPITWRLDPLFANAAIPSWSNLCPGTYTVVRVDGGCCQVYCQVNLTFTQTDIKQNSIQKFFFTYDNSERVIKFNNQLANSVIKIFDLTAKVVKEKPLDIRVDQINITDLEVGLYIVILYIDNRPQSQFKIIRQ